jgi:hypothetical protein
MNHVSLQPRRLGKTKQNPRREKESLLYVMWNRSWIV